MPATLARLVFVTAVFISSPTMSAAREGSFRETPLVRAVRECRGAIVNIHTEKSAASERDKRFFTPKERKVTGMGTGIVVDERGFICTNFHVIHDVDQIIVTQEDGTTYSATPVSFDRKHDLAIIRIRPTKPLKVMEMGTSSDVMLAEQVFAVGNAYGYEHTVTAGIVSSVSRDVEVDETQSYANLIQTDASINPGNSGGPLLNLDGEIIGINVAIRAGAQRIGFAIPIDDARRIIAELLSTERLDHVRHGMAGSDVNTAGDQHLVVDSVTAGSPAERCGLAAGDVVRRVRDVSITDRADWERSLLELAPGEKIAVSVERDGRTVDLELVMDLPQAGSSSTASAVSADSSSVMVSATADSVSASGTQLAWNLFGVRLSDLSARERRSLPSRYNGGMKILFVQSGGLGARHGLRNGDILVGMDGYETVAEENLEFVLNEDRVKEMNRISFQILRNGSQALVGGINLKENGRPHHRSAGRKSSGRSHSGRR